MNNVLQIKYDEQKQAQIISDGLKTADRYINKNYLNNLSDYNVLPLDEQEKDISFLRLYKIEKLIYDKKEDANDKLISVYSALLNIDSSALLLLNGQKTCVNIYIGIRSNENAAVAGTVLEKSFEGNFPGSTLTKMNNREISDVMSHAISNAQTASLKNVSCVTVVPSMRDENKDKYIQGIDKFLNTMQGEEFTAVLIAQPLTKVDVELRKRGLEELYSALSPFSKTSLAYGENYSKAVTKGMCENFSHSVNSSISNTTSNSKSDSVTRNSGMNFGIYGSGGNTGSSRGYTVGTTWTNGVTTGDSDTYSRGTNSSVSETDGTSKTITSEHHNKSVFSLMERIDEQLKRIKDCEGYGMWECAGYFVSENIKTSIVAANTYKALMLGNDTSVENSYINIWDMRSSDVMRERVLEYVTYGLHPVIGINAENGYNGQLVTPGNCISGKELPILMGTPRKAVAGVPVSTIAEFGRNVFEQNKNDDQSKIRLGRVHHMGKTEEVSVNLDLNSFSSHCFITGSTGSGKSNTVYGLLDKFNQNNIPFLIIEPAKGEYKDAFGGLKDINIFTTNPYIGQTLKINPFSFPPQIHVLEHIDRLIEIFNACWEMYAAMPAILKEAVEKIYIEKGWDLVNSMYRGSGNPEFPTFNDLLAVLPNIIGNSSYSADTKGDYVGALVTRVTSLTNGISGHVFCDNYELPNSVLFDENTIVDLSRVGSSETKSLIMGIIVLKLTEHRISASNKANSSLRHITVLEEAHNLLKKTNVQNAGSNVIGKSVEMICNSIAEMRTYGEGFIIVDQSPMSVDSAAIKNTNTKIVMRLPERNDCEAMAGSVNLNEEQKKEISKLETGIAVVMQNNWLESVLAHVDYYENNNGAAVVTDTYASIKALRSAVVTELLKQYIADGSIDVERMARIIDSINVSIHKKSEYKRRISNALSLLSQKRDIDLFCKTLYNTCGADAVFNVIEPIIQPSKDKEKGIYSKESVEQWKAKLSAEIALHIDIPAQYAPTLIDHLLYVQEERCKNVDYYEVQRILNAEIK